MLQCYINLIVTFFSMKKTFISKFSSFSQINPITYLVTTTSNDLKFFVMQYVPVKK